MTTELVEFGPCAPVALQEFAPDIVFIATHGTPGEDGAAQGLLDVLGIPYTGSRILGSAVSMHKVVTKRLLAAAGIPIVPYVPFCVRERHEEGPDATRAIQSFGLPLVVKPATEGSSVGVRICHTLADVIDAVKGIAKYGCCGLFEVYVKGREINCGVLDGEDGPVALPLIEIRPKNEFFDYEAKYTPGMAEEISPAPVDAKVAERGQTLAVEAFNALYCEGVARIDMFLLGDTEYVVSEANTIPGMTAESLLPKEAQAAGMPFHALLEAIIKHGRARRTSDGQPEG